MDPSSPPGRMGLGGLSGVKHSTNPTPLNPMVYRPRHYALVDTRDDSEVSRYADLHDAQESADELNTRESHARFVGRYDGPLDAAPAPVAAFLDEFRFLSNFWPCEITYYGRLYPSVEHAYQAAKFPIGTDRDAFVSEPPPCLGGEPRKRLTPGQAKRRAADDAHPCVRVARPVAEGVVP